MFIAFGMMTSYIPGITGGVVQTGWALLLIAAPFLLRRPVEMTAIHFLGLLTLLYAGLSLIWAPHGTFAMLQLGALGSVFVWAPDMRKVAIGLAAGLSISAALSILQWNGINLVYRATMFPSGLFVNHDVFAEISAVVLVLLLTHRLWWWLPVCLPGLAIGSRASIMALTCMFLVWVWSRSKITGAALTAVLGGLTVQAITSFSTGTIGQRAALWRDAIDGFTIWGHGIGSYEYLQPFYAGHISVLLDPLKDRSYFAHNDVLQLIFELGIGAAPIIIAVAMLLMVKDNHRYVLICVLVISMFAFPLHVPVEAFVAAVAAGHLARKYEPVRNLLAFGMGDYCGIVWAKGNRGRSALPERMETAI